MILKLKKHNNVKSGAYLMFCIILSMFCVTRVNSKVVKRDLMDNINNGIKYAGQMLGISTASDVATLVAKAFNQNTATKKEDSPSLLTSSASTSDNSFDSANLLNGILKVMGFDGSKIGAMAVNGIIFIAQMLGNVLTNTFRPKSPEHTDQLKEEHQPRFEDNTERLDREARAGSPLEWIISNPSEKLSKLMVELRDRKLPENLALEIDSKQQNEGDSDCVQLVLCKTAPFVWGMQKSVANRIESKNGIDDGTEQNRIDVFFKHLPKLEEYKLHGQQCDERYSNCNIFKL